MASTSVNQSENQSTSQGLSQSAQQASSASQSGSFIPNYSQTPILESIAKYAENMAPQVYQWGMDVYGKNQGNIDDLMRTADTYASGPRVAYDMGQAESGVEQAGEHALENSKQDLESYGIDPSSGRYAALDKAAKVQTAAAAAGAGNQQRASDFATSNAMKNQAISASLQNAASGNASNNTANSFLSTAIRLPYSPLGQQSSSASQSSGGSQSQNQSQSSGYSTGKSTSVDGSGGGGSKGGGNPQQPAGGGSGGGSPGGGSGGGSPGTGLGSPYGDPGMGGDPYGNDGGNTDPWYNGTPGVGTYPGDDGGSPWGAYNPDAGDPNGGWNTSPGTTWSDPGFNGDWGPTPDTGSGDYAEGGPVDPDNDQDQDLPGGYDPDQDGQMVHPGMSPSGGQAIDDVPANLNAGEFVMPDDVVRWKGEEFFQGLISKSRQAREGIMAQHGQTQGQDMGGAI